MRIVHWASACLVAFSWWSGSYGHLQWHRYSGYTLLALLLFRLFWGLFGSSTARFTQFVRGPRTVWAYLRQPHPDRAVGHNPLGALSVLALLAALGAQILSGLFAVDTDGLESGPLAIHVSFRVGRRWAEFHETWIYALLGLIALHVLTIALYRWVKQQNLLLPMLSGRAPLPLGATAHLRFASAARAVIGALLAGLLTWALARGLVW